MVYNIQNIRNWWLIQIVPEMSSLTKESRSKRNCNVWKNLGSQKIGALSYYLTTPWKSNRLSFAWMIFSVCLLPLMWIRAHAFFLRRSEQVLADQKRRQGLERTCPSVPHPVNTCGTMHAHTPPHLLPDSPSPQRSLQHPSRPVIQASTWQIRVPRVASSLPPPSCITWQTTWLGGYTVVLQGGGSSVRRGSTDR